MTLRDVIPKKWLTSEEVAHYVGLRESTIRAYVSEGRIPYYKIPSSNQVRFHIEEIDGWMREGLVKVQEPENERKEIGDGTAVPT